MQVWMSNTRGSVAYELSFFKTICENLIQQRGTFQVAERFASLLTLASLPWLDQPHFLEPGRLISELHEAWEELWTMQLSRCHPAPKRARSAHGRHHQIWYGPETFYGGEVTLGMCLARPMHQLATFAASGGKGARLRVGTHRRLIVDQEHLGGWRVIRGGAT